MSEKGKSSKIGKYEILEKIGEGGFGIVYRARDPMLERDVAVKVLKSEVATSPDFVERFQREAHLAAALHHPNIVNVIEVGEQEGRLFLVMDLLSGGTLSKLLLEGKPLPLARAVELLKPIADALDYAHGNGMIHRDVKPSNIILNDDGMPVLTDFGLGKSLSETGASTTGVALGTVEYMSPEQILGKTSSPATDIYAFGVIAFQMLAGQLPFSGATPYTIQKGHAEETPPNPSEINPSLGEQTTQILLKSLEKEPKLRFQSGAEMVAALSAAAEREQEDYWKELYDEAKALMEKKEFTLAIEKWEALQKAHFGFQDADEEEAFARKQVVLAKRYDRLVKQVGELKKEAQAILSIDGNYPDSMEVFERLGVGKSQPTEPEDKESEIAKENEKLGLSVVRASQAHATESYEKAINKASQSRPPQKSNLTGLQTLLIVLGIIGIVLSLFLILSGDNTAADIFFIATAIVWVVYFFARARNI